MDTMYDYIYSEQEILTALIENYCHPQVSFKRLFIIGCGSSFNSGKMAEPFLVDYGMSVSVFHPVEFMATQWHMRRDDLAIFISQVGNSALVLRALRSVKGSCATLALTSNPEGEIAGEADFCINIGCGEEKWNAKTKGVSCTVLSLLLFGIHAAREQGKINEIQFAGEISELQKIVGMLYHYTKELDRQMDKFIDLVEPQNALWVISTGHNYPVAREFAMKVTECAYIKASYKESEEFLHGFEMGADANDVFLIFALDSESFAFGDGLKRFLIGNGLTDRICIVSNRGGGDIETSVPDSRFNNFVGLVFLQLAAWKLSLKFEIDSRQVRYKNINEFVETKM